MRMRSGHRGRYQVKVGQKVVIERASGHGAVLVVAENEGGRSIRDEFRDSEGAAARVSGGI